MSKEETGAAPQETAAASSGVPLVVNDGFNMAAEIVRLRRLQALDDPIRGGLGNAHSRFLHVTEQGAKVRRAGSRVVVTKEEAKLLEVPLIKLQGILLYGNVQVSTPCIAGLLEEGVWLSFLSRGGTYRGRLQPPHERGGRLRQMQWHRSKDAAFCLRFARAVVRGKILGQKTVASAYARNYLAETLGDSHTTLGEALARVESAGTLEELRGVEGNASRAYFDLFKKCNRSDLPFDGRSKPAAVDPINALLNFGYTLLTRELEGLIESAGLDPAVGFYHQAHNDRPSLACDWVEEFRHVVVDRLVLKLINTGALHADHFEIHEDKGGMRLRPLGLRKFLVAYEKVVAGIGNDGPNTAYRDVFLNRLGAILDALSLAAGQYVSHFEAANQKTQAPCST